MRTLRIEPEFGLECNPSQVKNVYSLVVVRVLMKGFLIPCKCVFSVFEAVFWCILKFGGTIERDYESNERVYFCLSCCGQHLAADETQAGAHVNCPGCFHVLIIPNPTS